MQKYLERRRADYLACQIALRHQNFAFLARVGHTIKGNGDTFGFPELSTLGKELESAAARGDFSHITLLVGKLGDWLNCHSTAS
ncbi:MAG: Hpt domain-containing protein [Bdellovibrionales bacterium]